MSRFAPLPRTPEPELMDGEAQARAYAEADFSEPHDRFVTLFGEFFSGLAVAFPECHIDGVDGSAAMLAHAREAVAAADLAARIELLQDRLPEATLPAATPPARALEQRTISMPAGANRRVMPTRRSIDSAGYR